MCFVKQYGVQLKKNIILIFLYVDTKLLQLDIGSNSYPYLAYSFPNTFENFQPQKFLVRTVACQTCGNKQLSTS